MKFETEHFSRDDRYELGTELLSGKKYFAIPVSNRLCDYCEYYEISESEFQVFLSDAGEARKFSEACRRREKDERLYLKPGADRGV